MVTHKIDYIILKTSQNALRKFAFAHVFDRILANAALIFRILIGFSDSLFWDDHGNRYCSQFLSSVNQHQSLVLVTISFAVTHLENPEQYSSWMQVRTQQPSFFIGAYDEALSPNRFCISLNISVPFKSLCKNLLTAQYFPLSQKKTKLVYSESC